VGNINTLHISHQVSSIAVRLAAAATTSVVVEVTKVRERHGNYGSEKKGEKRR
jgi:hypothetical protein